MTDNEMLDAAEKYENERARWSVRHNKGKHADGLNWEVIQGPEGDDPISDETLAVQLRAYDRETAHDEMEILRGIACIKAAMQR